MNRILQRLFTLWAFESRLACPQRVRRQLFLELGPPAGVTERLEPAFRSERPAKPAHIRRGLPIKVMRRKS